VPQVLLERGGDLALLTALVSALVDEGAGGVAVIDGPPGVGKTRLIAAAVDDGRSRGATVLTAHGSELEHELAFGGVRQLLARAIASLDPEERARALGGPAAGAGAILGIAGVPAGGPDSGPGEPMFALTALVANLAELSPVMLVVDDVQWLDDASARFLVYLARRVEGQPILVLTARRPHDAPGDSPLDELLDVPVVTQITPDPLSVDGVRELLSAVLGRPIGSAVAAESTRLTGGNPYLVVEVARELAARGAGDNVTDLDEIAPATIGSSVLARIHRLAPPADALAGAIALFPDGTTLADAAAVAGIPVSAAAPAADALVEVNVLAPDSPLAFVHPIMRSAVYEQLGRFGRRAGHARAADILRARGAGVEEIAAHVLAGEPSGNPVTVEVLEAAAADAERSGAVFAAARYLSRAMDEPPPQDARVRLGHRLGKLQGQAGMPAAVATLRTALEHAPEADRVQIAIDLATVLDISGQGDDAVRTLLEARDAAAVDREQHLMVNALLAHFAWSSASYGTLYVEVADGLPADLPGTTPGERLALALVGARMFDRCEPHEATGAVLRRSLGADGSPLVTWNVELSDTLGLLIDSGMLDAAADVCRRRQDLARTSGRESDYLASLGGLALIEWTRGDLLGCEASLRLGLESPGGHPADRGMLFALLARISTAKGAFDEAESQLEAADADGDSSLTVRRWGELAMARGRTVDAVALFEEAHRYHVTRATLNPAENLWITDFAEALASLGRRDEALDLIADVFARAEAFGEAHAIGLANLALGRLTGGDEGIEHLERAAGILDRSPYRFTAARSRLALGGALRRANRRSEGRDHLRLALDYADRNGAVPLAAEARAELIAAGGRPRRHALSGVSALTPSERRIAGLAADGMSNREIADQLFVTVKTVEMHLGRSFEKLGVASRHDLGGVLHA